MRFDHTGVVAGSLEEGGRHLSDVFSIQHWTAEFTDRVNRSYVQLGSQASGMCDEIIAPLSDKGPLSSALRKRDRILKHVA